MIGKSLLLSFLLTASFTVSSAEQEQSELELYTQFLERYEKYSQSLALESHSPSVAQMLRSMVSIGLSAMQPTLMALPSIQQGI